MTRPLSQEPAHRECVDDGKGKRPVGFRRIVASPPMTIHYEDFFAFPWTRGFSSIQFAGPIPKRNAD
jgi:hypothetical protein